MSTKPSSSPSLLQKCLATSQALLFDPRFFWYLAALVVIGDAVLTGLIIRYVPYTEIDWETYMVHTKLILNGEHNYTMITGPTGPLVHVYFAYPAGHVRVHQILHAITDSGRDIPLAQVLYGALYLISLILSCAIYRSAGGIPNWVILLLPLSKRLHSIYVLRLFNDCWSVVAIQATILAFQNEFYETAVILFSVALSVKMGILLYLPALLVVDFKRNGLYMMGIHLVTIGSLQAFIATPFIREDPWAYFHTAFDLGRVFMYKWTVNWRMLGEETFLSSRTATTLLVGHATVLIAFGLFKWCDIDGGVLSVVYRGFLRPFSPAGLVIVTPDFVATVFFTANLVGMLFARSLHYQFYSWYAQQIPFLAWRTRFPLPVKLALIFGIEYAWNVFPSTPLSSSVLLFCNMLLVAGVFQGYPCGRHVQ